MKFQGFLRVFLSVKCDGFKGFSEEICSRDVIGWAQKKSLLGGGVSPPSGNCDNFIVKMVQSGAFWRCYLC